MKLVTLVWIVVTAVMLSAATSSAFPLSKTEQRCAGAVLNDSAKVLRAYRKAVATCVASIGGGKLVPPDLRDCVDADPKAKLASARSRVDATIDAKCAGLPYTMTCPFPCDASSIGGPTPGIDDTVELQACMQCINPAMVWADPAAAPAFRGLHRSILDAVTIVPKASSPDSRLASCVRPAPPMLRL